MDAIVFQIQEDGRGGLTDAVDAVRNAVGLTVGVVSRLRFIDSLPHLIGDSTIIACDCASKTFSSAAHYVVKTLAKWIRGVT